MTLTTTAALLLALILLPLLILLWAIADRLGCSRSTVRRLLAT